MYTRTHSASCTHVHTVLHVPTYPQCCMYPRTHSAACTHVHTVLHVPTYTQCCMYPCTHSAACTHVHTVLHVPMYTQCLTELSARFSSTECTVGVIAWHGTRMCT